jgi:hypothetical protein
MSKPGIVVTTLFGGGQPVFAEEAMSEPKERMGFCLS